MRKTIPAPERFWAKVEKTDTCWLWTGALDTRGYGQFRVASPPARPLQAYRYAFELLRGPVPQGLQLDHVCRVRRCVNPNHLEPVTGRENTLRGDGPPAQNARKTHCIRGHKLPPRNNQGRRKCRICQAITAAARRAA